MKAIINGRVYTPTRVIPQGVVLIRSGSGSSRWARRPRFPSPRGRSASMPRAPSSAQGWWISISMAATAPTPWTAAPKRCIRWPGAICVMAPPACCPPRPARPCCRCGRRFDAIRAVMRAPVWTRPACWGSTWRAISSHRRRRGSHAPSLLRMPTPAETEMLLSYVPDLEAGDAGAGARGRPGI